MNYPDTVFIDESLIINDSYGILYAKMAGLGSRKAVTFTATVPIKAYLAKTDISLWVQFASGERMWVPRSGVVKRYEDSIELKDWLIQEITTEFSQRRIKEVEIEGSV